jgi:hypothetical protein
VRRELLDRCRLVSAAFSSCWCADISAMSSSRQHPRRIGLAPVYIVLMARSSTPGRSPNHEVEDGGKRCSNGQCSYPSQ